MFQCIVRIQVGSRLTVESLQRGTALVTRRVECVTAHHRHSTDRRRQVETTQGLLKKRRRRRTINSTFERERTDLRLLLDDHRLEGTERAGRKNVQRVQGGLTPMEFIDQIQQWTTIERLVVVIDRDGRRTHSDTNSRD